MIDIHCHILPGLDDGPSSMDKAVAMALAAVSAGTTRIIATPHFKNGVFEVSPEMVKASVAVFIGVLEEKKIALEVLSGAEIRLSPDTCSQLDQGELLPLGASRYYLFELPDIFIKEGIIEMLRQFRQREVIPVIAHPERNRTIIRRPEIIREFIFENAQFQLTGKSFLADKSRQRFKIASTMVREGQAHFVASDGHDINHRPPSLDGVFNVLKKMAGERTATQIIFENPETFMAQTLKAQTAERNVEVI